MNHYYNDFLNNDLPIITYTRTFNNENIQIPKYEYKFMNLYEINEKVKNNYTCIGSIGAHVGDSDNSGTVADCTLETFYDNGIRIKNNTSNTITIYNKTAFIDRLYIRNDVYKSVE